MANVKKDYRGYQPKKDNVMKLSKYIGNGAEISERSAGVPHTTTSSHITFKQQLNNK
jgi:hypothetical protein